ncbi:zinc-binding alcohol dehydrogenase family protein [Streptantibioticus parmotrematis]|uniref:quinone oxidoreductase family protein n=1 Tax=Streptantibioticus parmotrematis TaxID=2873249 RepID=UPI0033FDDC04
MHAAVVHAYGEAPRYESLPDPEAAPGEVIVDVVAAGLHPLVRSVASGRHYTSDGTLPLVPGFDGVGRTPDGTLAYFAGRSGGNGSMAERVAVPERALVPLPDGLDPVTVAALMNPAMSAWLALRDRAGLRAGESVLVLGATGSAGRMAVQLARHLGAAEVVAAGRDADALHRLTAIGADRTVSLSAPDDDLTAAVAKAAADVDVVVDYVWGRPAELALAALTSARRDSAHPLRWVHVGATAGPTITLPAATLRKTAVEFRGSGLGSVAPDRMDAALRELVALLPSAGLHTATATTPLSDVQRAWDAELPSGTRLVLLP